MTQNLGIKQFLNNRHSEYSFFEKSPAHLGDNNLLSHDTVRLTQTFSSGKQPRQQHRSAHHSFDSLSHMVLLHHQSGPICVCCVCFIRAAQRQFHNVALLWAVCSQKLALCSLLTLSAWMINPHLWKWKEKEGPGAVNHQTTTAHWLPGEWEWNFLFTTSMVASHDIQHSKKKHDIYMLFCQRVALRKVKSNNNSMLRNNSEEKP